MDFYTIEYSPAAKRDILKLEKTVQKSIIEKMESLIPNPYPPDSVKIEGSKDFYRVREGNYRIIYTVEEGEITVLVLRIRDRKEIYKGKKYLKVLAEAKLSVSQVL